MAGKGDIRRPRQVSRDEYERRWEETFGGEDVERVRTKVGEFGGVPIIADLDVPRDEIHLVRSGEIRGTIVNVFADPDADNRVHTAASPEKDKGAAEGGSP